MYARFAWIHCPQAIPRYTTLWLAYAHHYRRITPIIHVSRYSTVLYAFRACISPESTGIHAKHYSGTYRPHANVYGKEHTPRALYHPPVTAGAEPERSPHKGETKDTIRGEKEKASRSTNFFLVSFSNHYCHYWYTSTSIPLSALLVYEYQYTSLPNIRKT